MVTLSLSDLITIAGGVGLALWGLIKVIFYYHHKDYQDHKIGCQQFRINQDLENRLNEKFRHKYDDFDKTVSKLVDQTEARLSEKINNCIAPLSKSIEAIHEIMNLILGKFLEKDK